MLVLSRRQDEMIRINDDITIRVVDIKKGSVRLGITAPKNVSVDREEIYQRRLRNYGFQDESQDEREDDSTGFTYEGPYP